ncbi:DIP1984 family protein [Parasutterella secunda]|uniref:DIP1984 family protein n=1 Tax=Parasutterella secunda TaxID=626947 RepID=UPI0025A3A7F9|nr:DIP1984 family protein [Parasutterella secunda]MDM8088190.1 DIP1984 family protein [Parasutterella secunda]
MKLAEALILRKDLQTRVARIRDRLFANVLVQEGDKPSEDPAELIVRLNEMLAELGSLISKINKTNSSTLLDGKPLADAITERDIALRKVNILREALQKAADRPKRYSQKEIRLLTPLDVRKEEKIVDKIAYEARVLDAKIQAKNWEVELL